MSRRLGLFPYSFDPETLQLSPVRTGFSYYHFLVNMAYMVVTTLTRAGLFLENWRTNFEFEEIQGGYNIQFTYLTGQLLHFTMLCGIVLYMDKFAYAVSSAIRVEAKIMQGMLLPVVHRL